MPLRLLPIAIDVPATMLSVERKAMAKTKMTMWGASAERLGEGSRVAVPVDATTPLARRHLRSNTQRASHGPRELESVGDREFSAKADQLGLGRAKLRLAREFVSHSCDRLIKIAMAPRDSSARKRIGPRVTLALPSTIMPATPRSPL